MYSSSLVGSSYVALVCLLCLSALAAMAAGVSGLPPDLRSTGWLTPVSVLDLVWRCDPGVAVVAAIMVTPADLLFPPTSSASRRRLLQRCWAVGWTCTGVSAVGLVWLMAGWSGVYSALGLWSAAGGSASASRLRRRERPDPKVGCELGDDPRPACHSDRWAPLVLLLVVLKAVLAMKLLQPWVCGSLLSSLVLLAGAGDEWDAGVRVELRLPLLFSCMRILYSVCL
jgi:hypothetical protein